MQSSIRTTLGRYARPTLIGLLAVFLAACSEAAPQSEAPPPVVQVTTVRYEPDRTERSYVGVVRARTETTAAFRVGGKVVERLVDVGDRVEAGAILARLDAVDFVLQVESAEAEVAAAAAAVSSAAADLDRAQRLAAQNHLATAELEHRQLALNEASGRLARAERQLDLARNQQSYAALVATGAGIVTAVSAEAGQVVSVGQPIVTTAALDELEIAVAIPEAAVAGLGTTKASVSFWADGIARRPATLRELAPEADPVARTFAARFSIDGADARLGMTATLFLESGSGNDVARLPLSAVLDQGQGPSVYVVDRNEALVLRPVEVVRYGSSEAVLAAGVADGERVVTLGVNRLSAGQSVRATETPILQAQR